jgi:acetyl-CoA synthetase
LTEETKNPCVSNDSKTIVNEKIIEPAEFTYTNQTFHSFADFKERMDLFNTNPEKFWNEESENLSWFKKPKKIKTGVSFNSIWFVNSSFNITFNCIDRHLTFEGKNKAAIIWESESGKNWILTYQLLYSYVNKTANTIKELGLNKGDKVCIICGSLPETIFSVLACARLGITFTLLNPAISLSALKKRISKGNFSLIILTDGVYRKGNLIEIKVKVDESLQDLSLQIKKLIFRRSKNYELQLQSDTDFLASDFFEKVSDQCTPVPVSGNFPLFSIFDYDDKDNLTERFFPAAGFMVQTFTSSKYAFDLMADDIFFCNGDFSSIAGLAYGIFAPLLNGISTFVYEGLPNFPSNDRIWKMINNYKITKFLSDSYILKALVCYDNSDVNKSDLSSLKLISVSGNQLNEEEWGKIFSKLCFNKIPLTSCFISNEMGNIVFADIPGITQIRRGFVNAAFPSSKLEMMNIDFNKNENIKTTFVYKDSFPNFLKKFSDDNFFIKISRKKYLKSNYAVCRVDEWIKILERIDNKLEIAGEIISLLEIESVIKENPKVKSCKIQTKVDPILQYVPIAYVELNNPADGTLLFKEELRNQVEQKISAAAKPIDVIFI